MLLPNLVSCAGRASGYVPFSVIQALSWTGLWLPSYTTTWAGASSAGSSAGRDLVETTPFFVRTGILGPSLEYDVAESDGTDDDLVSTGTLASTFFSTTNFTAVSLVYLVSLPTDDTSANKGNNTCLWSSNGTLQEYCYCRNNGAGTDKVGLYWATPADHFVETDFAINAWQAVFCRGDGSTIEINVNDHGWASDTGGTNNSMGHTIRVGNSPYLDDFFPTGSRLAFTGFTDQKFDNATCTAILDDLRVSLDLALT